MRVTIIIVPLIFFSILAQLVFCQTEIPSVAWTRTYGGIATDYGYCVDKTTDGGYVIVGITESPDISKGGTDAWLIRLDANGDTLWARAYGAASGDQAFYVQQTADGGFIVAEQPCLGLSGAGRGNGGGVRAVV